ncbi:MAG: D-xylose transport system substrate-binding protein [Blastocatellia bacterium]|jgi:D-xylose transport system substrate-binding protein|nr:D-xylose transport system substrate-binding protein [Blastocatellia bacterium]
MRSISAGACLLLALSLSLATACVSGPQSQNAGGGCPPRAKKNGPVKIGFSMDTLKEERWQRDKELVEQRAKELGAELIVQVANGDDNVQTKQADNLLTQNVDVLIVAPHNGVVAASIVEAAKKQCVPVISYDRLIRNSDVDLYVSHQVVKIGEMQAKYLLDRVPKGNYLIIGGSPTDNNAQLLHDGQMNILKPAIERGDVKIVGDQPSKEWLASEAQKNTENALTQNNNNIQAVVAANDGTAGGVIQALGPLAGNPVLVSGQDAELPACQRIAEGKQAMTVYKPIRPLAFSAVEAAIKLANGEKVEAPDKVNNGKIDVPSILQEPIAVGKENMMDTIIKDGYHKMEKVYENVPKEQWPKAAEAAPAKAEEHRRANIGSSSIAFFFSLLALGCLLIPRVRR